MVIDKSNWIPVKLAEVTVKKEENDKANASSKFNKFLKVEHMDAESLHIKRCGTIGEEELPPTFYKIFRKGQVLYPTRNPHLKRVAVASFDGICGEKTLTLEPIKDLIDPKLYPFIFLAHSFFSHTTKSIIGSTNPHVRWRDVAEYNFLLPPKDQQSKLAELLWAADEVVQKTIKIIDALRNLYTNYVSQLSNSSPKKSYLHQMGELIRGVGYSPLNVMNDYSNDSFVLLRSNNINENGLILENLVFIDKMKLKPKQNLMNGDLLICMSNGSKELVGKACEYTISDYNRISVGSFCALFRPLKKYQKIVKYLFNSPLYKEQIQVLLSGSNINNLKPSDIESISFNLDNQSLDDSLVIKIDKINELIRAYSNKLKDEVFIQKQLINQIFS